MEKFIQCRKCLNKNLSYLSGKPIAPPGYIVKQAESENGVRPNDLVYECECHKEWRMKHELEVAAKRASLSPQWIDYDPEKDYVGDESKNEIERIITFTKRSTDPNETNDVKAKLATAVLYLYGTNGTQKTTVANWTGYEFLKAKKSVKYILMNDLIKLLQKADRDDEALAKVEKLESVDLLIVDEAFDKGKVTLYKSNWQHSFLDTFLRSRIQTHNKGIIFVSNVSPYDIEDTGFNHSIQDLVIRNMEKFNGLLEFKDRYNIIKSTVDTECLF